ncbi:rhodanese-like domain-containing protein [Candidatus Woesearchaeota archaeon]|nr:rhodanese-like domain-containing protein [Candidatus Woesearchaeota archaeon]
MEKEIDVFELKEKLENKEVILVDVREEFELAISKLKYDVFLPIGKIMQGNFDSLKKEDNIVFYCRSGNRSLRAVDIFLSKGFNNVKSLKGGINEWAEKIDNSLETY